MPALFRRRRNPPIPQAQSPDMLSILTPEQKAQRWWWWWIGSLRTGRGGGRRSTRTAPVSCLRIVSSVSPNSGTMSAIFPVTISGALFAAGDAVTFAHSVSGAQLVVSNVIVVNDTTITADVLVDESSQLGNYNVSVGPPGSPQCIGVLPNGFAVT